MLLVSVLVLSALIIFGMMVVESKGDGGEGEGGGGCLKLGSPAWVILFRFGTLTNFKSCLLLVDVSNSCFSQGSSILRRALRRWEILKYKNIIM